MMAELLELACRFVTTCAFLRVYLFEDFLQDSFLQTTSRKMESPALPSVSWTIPKSRHINSRFSPAVSEAVSRNYCTSHKRDPRHLITMTLPAN